MGISFLTFEHDCEQAHWFLYASFPPAVLFCLSSFSCVESRDIFGGACLEAFIRRYLAYDWSKAHSQPVVPNSPCLYCLGSEKAFSSKLWKNFHQLHGSEHKITSDKLAEKMGTDGMEKKRWSQELLYLASGYPSIKICFVLSRQMPDNRLRNKEYKLRLENGVVCLGKQWLWKEFRGHSRYMMPKTFMWCCGKRFNAIHGYINTGVEGGEHTSVWLLLQYSVLFWSPYF